MTARTSKSQRFSLKFDKTFESDQKGEQRMCQKCVKRKPDRCHHCSQCNECILKMDHHCPWIANCVGYRNYKFFLLTLIYAALSCWIMVFTYWNNLVRMTYLQGTPNVAVVYFSQIAYFISTIMAMLLTGFFFFHMHLIVTGYTTIEYCEKRILMTALYKKNPYNLGFCENLKQAFGPNIWIWLLPFRAYSDEYNGKGIYFKTDTNSKSLGKGKNLRGDSKERKPLLRAG